MVESTKCTGLAPQRPLLHQLRLAWATRTLSALVITKARAYHEFQHVSTDNVVVCVVCEATV